MRTPDGGGCWLCLILGRSENRVAQWMLRKHLRRMW